MPPIDDLGAWADARPKRRRGAPKMSRSKVEALRQTAEERRLSQEWDDACAGEIVALYAWCHRAVYGVGCELDADLGGYHLAVAASRRMLAEDFGGDAALMVGFMRWVWAREKRQFPTRKNDFRIGWRYMFKVGGSLVVDWRIARLKKNA